jgi:hypothetical protein
MEYNLTCEQVTALLTFYVEDKLSEKLSGYVKAHLDNCPECQEKYRQLKNLLKRYNEIENSKATNPYVTKQYEDFKSNLSAYIDNELDNSESIKIKKIAISNPLARQDLEDIYTYKKLMHSAFEKTKNDLKSDYSKDTICKLRHNCFEVRKLDPFLKITAVFFIMVTFAVAGLITILYF